MTPENLPTSGTSSSEASPQKTEPSQDKAAPTATPPGAPKPISNVPTDERLISAAAYIPMLFVGALVMKPKSTFCQLHGKQGLILTILMFFTLFILALMPAIGSLLFLAMIGMIAIGAYQAYSGFEWKAPVIHGIAAKINVDQLFVGTTVKPTSTDTAKKPTDVNTKPEGNPSAETVAPTQSSSPAPDSNSKSNPKPS